MSSLLSQLKSSFANCTVLESGDWLIEVPQSEWLQTHKTLRDEFNFEQLMDLAGVDYLGFGQDEWKTQSATGSGFNRAVENIELKVPEGQTRFGVTTQLLSLAHNTRVMVKTLCDNDDLPRLPSLMPVYASVNWYEREAFDLFGIVFDEHPDLRRVLTDYGFIGHPFRKDFPLIGETEVRYDALQERVVYEPVSIVPRTLVPKVIRDDERFNPELFPVNSALPEDAGKQDVADSAASKGEPHG